MNFERNLFNNPQPGDQLDVFEHAPKNQKTENQKLTPQEEKEVAKIKQLAEEPTLEERIDVLSKKTWEKNPISEVTEDVRNFFEQHDFGVITEVSSAFAVKESNSVVNKYGEYGFFGKVFNDTEHNKVLFEVWRVKDDGSEEFVKRQKNVQPTDLSPVYSSKDNILKSFQE